MTHEPELTSPVDLCRPDGGPLNPAARGWSRHPLHRANLDGGDPGRNKRWDYWAVVAGDVVVSCVYADIDVLGLADAWWARPATGRTGGHAVVTGPGAVRLPQLCGTSELHIERDGLSLTIGAEDAAGAHLEAAWTEPDGRPSSFDIQVARPPGLESVNVFVVPWSDDTFNFTSKQVARPAVGVLRTGDEEFVLGADGDAWGSSTWDGAGGRPGSPGTGRGVGTGRRHRRRPAVRGEVDRGDRRHRERVRPRRARDQAGRELDWSYRWDDPLAPWSVEDPGGQLSAVLTPDYDKHTVTGDSRVGSEVHQVFGTYTGRVTDDAGRTVEFSGLRGFAEEARQAW